MALATLKDAYTPAQVSAVTGLPLPAVHRAIENAVIRPQRVKDRQGHAARRLLSKAQVLYLLMEAKGLRFLPLSKRRQVARAVERDSGIDLMAISEGSVILIQIKSARKELETGLRRLAEAARIAVSDPEIMRGAPVYRGTRIPVHAIADMLARGVSAEEIAEGYPALTHNQIELAPMYVKAFPRRGRPSARPWAGTRPRRISRGRLPG